MNLRKRLPDFLLFLFFAAVITLLPPSSAARADTVSTSALSGEWVKEDGKLKYCYSDGTYASSGFVKIGKYRYYFRRDGVVKTGWITEKNNTYYASRKKTAGKQNSDTEQSCKKPSCTGAKTMKRNPASPIKTSKNI